MFKCIRCDALVRVSRTEETMDFVVQTKLDSENGSLCADCTDDFYEFIEGEE